MKMRFLACAAATLLATEVAAQTVAVRAGEHPEFTRLIIDLPERTEWQVDSNDDEAVISFSNTSLSFDTSSVFKRIPRERLVDVVAAAPKGTLKLMLGCDCEVSSFWHGKSLLVFDVRERTKDASEGPAPKNAQPPAKTRVERSPLQKAQRLNVERTSLAANLAIPEIKKNVKIEDIPDTSKQPVQNPRAVDNSLIIDNSRDLLVKQLGRAATQGLVSPSASLSIRNPKAPGGETNLQEAESEAPLEEAPDHINNPTAHINLQAQSSIDRDIAAILSAQENRIEETECIDPGLVDVGNWGTTAPFHQQISTLRVRLMGEFDKIDQDAVITLTRLYLYFGFGEEARHILELTDRKTEEISMLKALIGIMEEGHASNRSVLAAQLRCETPAALWSVLSYEDLPSDVPINTDAVLRAISSLPKHLRRYLGPILSKRLLDSGRREVAENVLRILERNSETVTPNAEFVGAVADIESGANDTAVKALEEVAESNSEPSAEAVVALIRTKLAEDEEVSFELAQLAGAYLQENKGQPLGADLSQVYVLALAASGAFDQTYHELERVSRDLDAADLNDLKSSVLSQLSNKSNDVTFLQYALGTHAADSSTLNPRVANAAAQRLIDLGFVTQAKPFLETSVTGDAARLRKILRAKVALDEGRPRLAEVELMHLEDPEADLLRARIRSAVGEHDEASKIYASADQNALSETEAWLAEDWQNVAAADEGAEAEMAALILSKSETASQEQDMDEEGVLAQNRVLIEKSEEVRNTVEALLGARPMPIVSEE